MMVEDCSLPRAGKNVWRSVYIFPFQDFVCSSFMNVVGRTPSHGSGVHVRLSLAHEGRTFLVCGKDEGGRWDCLYQELDDEGRASFRRRC